VPTRGSSMHQIRLLLGTGKRKSVRKNVLQKGDEIKK